MNYNKKVVVFTLCATFLLLIYSIYAKESGNDFLALKNVNVVSDILVDNHKAGPAAPTSKKPIVAMQADPAKNVRDLYMYTVPRRLISFNTDTNLAALPRLAQKLDSLKQGRKAKIRIAWLGDSMIEGDLLTQTFRKLMQAQVGGYGVGFVPVKAVTSRFRNTVRSDASGDWKEESFKDKDPVASMFFSGHTFTTSNGSLTMTDVTVKDTTQVLVKHLLCGYADGNVNIKVNGIDKQFHTPGRFNAILLDSSVKHAINVSVDNNKLPVYGIEFEPISGVVVDNFSFRGITGVELKKLDTSLLTEIDQQQYYDLVVLEYGVNLLFRPNDIDYSYYKRLMGKVLPQLHRAMPHTSFLVMGSADRAFSYEDGFKTAIGMDSLLKVQAALAYENGMTFYNLYESMGGYGTIVKWAQTDPPLANPDYVHPNQRGAEFLGTMLFDDFMKDYNKINREHKN